MGGNLRSSFTCPFRMKRNRSRRRDLRILKNIHQSHISRNLIQTFAEELKIPKLSSCVEEGISFFQSLIKWKFPVSNSNCQFEAIRLSQKSFLLINWRIIPLFICSIRLKRGFLFECIMNTEQHPLWQARKCTDYEIEIKSGWAELFYSFLFPIQRTLQCPRASWILTHKARQEIIEASAFHYPLGLAQWPEGKKEEISNRAIRGTVCNNPVSNTRLAVKVVCEIGTVTV